MRAEGKGTLLFLVRDFSSFSYHTHAHTYTHATLRNRSFSFRFFGVRHLKRHTHINCSPPELTECVLCYGTQATSCVVLGSHPPAKAAEVGFWGRRGWVGLVYSLTG